jgi:hypothetical protein
MANTKSTSEWIRDILIVPLIVGLVVAIFAYGLPKLLEKGKNISYSIEGPVTYLDMGKVNINGVQIKVNDKQISRLLIYKVKIWNSGDLPLANLPIRLVFNTSDPNFEIFSINHETKPPYEFGNITDEKLESNSLKVTYALLNENDEDIITILANDSPALELFSKIEGLSVKKIEQNKWFENTSVLAIISAVIGAIASILSALLSTGIKRFQIRSSGIITPDSLKNNRTRP